MSPLSVSRVVRYLAVVGALCAGAGANAQDLDIAMTIAVAGGEPVSEELEAFLGEENSLSVEGPFRWVVVPSLTNNGMVMLEFLRYDRNNEDAEPISGPRLATANGREAKVEQGTQPPGASNISITATPRLR
jgi:hypothetical protein